MWHEFGICLIALHLSIGLFKEPPKFPDLFHLETSLAGVPIFKAWHTLGLKWAGARCALVSVGAPLVFLSRTHPLSWVNPPPRYEATSNSNICVTWRWYVHLLVYVEHPHPKSETLCLWAGGKTSTRAGFPVRILYPVSTWFDKKLSTNLIRYFFINLFTSLPDKNYCSFRGTFEFEGIGRSCPMIRR